MNFMNFQGLKVVVTATAELRPWQFPQDRFITYEETDEWWGRKYGLGQEGPSEPCVYRVGNTLLIHPKLWEQLKRATAVYRAGFSSWKEE